MALGATHTKRHEAQVSAFGGVGVGPALRFNNSRKGPGSIPSRGAKHRLQGDFEGSGWVYSNVARGDVIVVSEVTGGCTTCGAGSCGKMRRWRGQQLSCCPLPQGWRPWLGSSFNSARFARGPPRRECVRGSRSVDVPRRASGPAAWGGVADIRS